MEFSSVENGLQKVDTAHLELSTSLGSPELHADSKEAPMTPKLNSAYPVQSASPTQSTRSSSNTSSSIPTILITDTSARRPFLRYTIKKLFELQQAAPVLICDLKTFRPAAFEGQFSKFWWIFADHVTREYPTTARRVQY
jgi:hypothetical protein